VASFGLGTLRAADSCLSRSVVIKLSSRGKRESTLELANYGSIAAHGECVSNVTGQVSPPVAMVDAKTSRDRRALEDPEPGGIAAISPSRLFAVIRPSRNRSTEASPRRGRSPAGCHGASISSG
jgi:hypothetical protein